jgi:hypothetical protein
MQHNEANEHGGSREDGNLLANLDRSVIEAAYSAAPGNEVSSGKFLSPQSSAALVANTFGLFLDRPELLPAFASLEQLGWPAQEVNLEVIVQFPWRGGRHPCLDVLVRTSEAIIGVESKRYEPFRPRAASELSRAYWRKVWGSRMGGYEHVRDRLDAAPSTFKHLDAAQLIKHAFALRTEASRTGAKPVLVYLFAEPEAWPEGAPINREAAARHRQELSFFSAAVRDDEVQFVSMTYQDLFASWLTEGASAVQEHAQAVPEHFRCGPFEPLWRKDQP